MRSAGAAAAACRRTGPFLLLAGQNLGIFFWHYFKGSIFPWDFVQTYFAVPYFWIASLRSGVFPTWVPFQAIGYPLQMFLQSGLFYPPLHFFVGTGVPYSLEAAVVFQCLHVLLGACGAFVLLRRFGLTPGPALFGAFAYQLFGGFYANAEHVDIVRGYALTPWLFAGLQRDRREGPPKATLFPVVAVPLGTFLLFTGGYPGQAMAAMAMGVLFVAAQFTVDRCGPSPRTLAPGWAFSRVGLLLLGMLLAAVHFLPAFLMRGELERHVSAAQQMRSFLSIRHLLTLFNSVNHPVLSQDISMRSLYVTLPVVALLFFLTRATIVAVMPWLVVWAAGLLMISGGPVYRIVVTILGPLGLSRFPSGDYRFFVCFPLILAAAHAVAQPVRLSRRSLAVRGACFLLLVGSSIPLLRIQPWIGTDAAGLVVLALALAAVLGLQRSRQFPLPWLLALLMLFAAADGWRVRSDEKLTWRVDGWLGTYAWLTHVDLHAPPRDLIEQITGNVRPRPARQDPEKGYKFLGYLNGQYYMRDVSGGMQLRRQRSLLADETFRAFALLPSSWLIFPLPGDVTAADFKAGVAALAGTDADRRARLLAFRPDGADYSIRSSDGFLLVENESYFPGWSALAGGIRYEASDVFGFRGWKLPPGDYRLTTQFRMPYLRTSAAISSCALAVWLGVMLAQFVRRRSVFAGLLTI
jgi:hypothetical protein